MAGNRMLATFGNSGNYIDGQAGYTWDNQGRMTSMTYPTGEKMAYTYDPMSRMTGIAESNCVSSPQVQCQNEAVTAAYGSAGQMTQLTWGAASSTPTFTENRTYNNLLQLTHQTVTGEVYIQGAYQSGPFVDMQYIFNAGHNNGRVTQTIDGVLGETVNYTYDWLHRLTGAAATNGTWGESYSFDGFGNLTGKTPTAGSAPPLSWGGNSATNAIPPVDANGNMATNDLWDSENRLIQSGNTKYAYDPWGRRVWKQITNPNDLSTTFEVYFYGATGQKLEPAAGTRSTAATSAAGTGSSTRTSGVR